MSTGSDDNEIISKVIAGDQQAYALLVNRYNNYVFTLVMRFTRSREDAEEIAQDVFVKAYKALASFRGDSKFSTWLYTITNTTSISFLRKKKVSLYSLDDERVQEQASGMSANLVEQKSRITMVNSAIAMLEPNDAQMITLFYQAEQSLEEIAKILSIEVNAAKVRLHRARTRLRDKLEKHFTSELKQY